MNKSAPPHSDTREHLLATGEELSMRLGFTAMGLTEILTTAGVPKGSFYHHFKSKEAFGEAMIQRYFDNYEQALRRHFNQPNGNQRQHLLSYYAQAITNFCNSQCHNACLAVKVSAEVSDLSEPMRHVLEKGTATVVKQLATAIEQGIAEGSLQVLQPPAVAAEIIYSLWLGASLRAKIKHSVAPLAAALELLEILLQPPAGA
jgi:TetR/AcrR family transcriptional repressor of nem operon